MTSGETSEASDRFTVGSLLRSPYAEMVWLTILAVGIGNAFSYGIGVGYGAAGGAPVSPLVSTGISVLSLQVVGMLGTALVYLWLRDRWNLITVRWPSVRTVMLIAGGFVAAFIINIVRTVIMVGLGFEASSPIVEVGTGGDAATALLLLTVASFLVIAPIEELLFRGVIQGSLREAYGPSVAIITASLLFAAMHLPGLGGLLSGRLATVAGIFVVSLVFGWLYERTGNLVVPTVVHGLYNASLFAILYILLSSGAL